MDAPYKGTRVTVEQLRGLNEREQFSNSDLGNFDFLKGVVPTNFNTLTRPGAIALLQTISPSENILQICQTNDTSKNIIVQTDKAIRIISESDFFNTPYTPSFVNVPINDDDIMPRAILAHTAAAGGTGGGSSATSLTQMPITEIVSQVNADGTAASFCTLTTNQFTLSAGVYYINGWHKLFHATLNKIGQGQLFNITAGTAAWAGAVNQDTNKIIFDGTSDFYLYFKGILQPAVPTIYEWRAIVSTVQATTGLGRTTNTSPLNTSRETYGVLDIIKTA